MNSKIRRILSKSPAPIKVTPFDGTYDVTNSYFFDMEFSIKLLFEIDLYDTESVI